LETLKRFRIECLEIDLEPLVVCSCLAHEVLVSIPVVLVEGILQLLNAVSCEGFQALRDEICLLKYVEMTISFFSAPLIISPARSSMETKGYLSSHAL